MALATMPNNVRYRIETAIANAAERADETFLGQCWAEKTDLREFIGSWSDHRLPIRTTSCALSSGPGQEPGKERGNPIVVSIVNVPGAECERP